MNKETKELIIAAAMEYCAEQGWVKETGEFGLNKLIDLSGVSATYLSPMMRGEPTYRVGDKVLQTKDKYYEALARSIGYNYEKSYWDHRNTSQFRKIYMELEGAKNNGFTRMIIGESGCGKTYAIQKFKQRNPLSTWVVTCYKSDNFSDLIRKIESAMGMSNRGSLSERIDAISVQFHRKQDENPVLIIDESETLDKKGLTGLKNLYDSLKLGKSIVLVGTEELLNRLEYLVHKNEPGMKQFYRRFSTGIRVLKPMEKEVRGVIKEYGFDSEMERWMMEQCSDYGKVYDLLVPALKRADELDVAFDLEFLKAYHGEE